MKEALGIGAAVLMVVCCASLSLLVGLGTASASGVLSGAGLVLVLGGAVVLGISFCRKKGKGCWEIHQLPEETAQKAQDDDQRWDRRS